MQSRLDKLSLQSIDVGGAGDCFFNLDLYHINYMAIATIMCKRTAGVQFVRENPERFIESNTKNSWLRYLNNMCIQGTRADALIIQAVVDALKVTIQIVQSNQGFAPLTTVYPVQERNTLSTITIGHIDECHYVSTTVLQSNASISTCNELTNDTQSSRNKHFIMSIYAVCFSVMKSCTCLDSSTLQALYEHACLFYEKCNVDRVDKMPSNIIVYDAEIKIKYSHLNQGSLT